MYPCVLRCCPALAFLAFSLSPGFPVSSCLFLSSPLLCFPILLLSLLCLYFLLSPVFSSFISLHYVPLSSSSSSSLLVLSSSLLFPPLRFPPLLLPNLFFLLPLFPAHLILSLAPGSGMSRGICADVFTSPVNHPHPPRGCRTAAFYFAATFFADFVFAFSTLSATFSVAFAVDFRTFGAVSVLAALVVDLCAVFFFGSSGLLALRAWIMA